jgi:adenosine deaminase
LPQLRAAGLAVTLNTDIPEMVHTTLDAEYAAAAREFGWTTTDLADLARTSIDASFADPATKSRLHAGLTPA